METRRYQLTYTDTDGNTVSVTWRNEGAEHFAVAARSVMLAANYMPETVDEFIPHLDRPWVYTDEMEEK